MCTNLFEVDALVVQRLQIILLQLVPPGLIERPLSLAPLLLLGLEPLQDNGHGNARTLLQALDDVMCFLAIDAVDGLALEDLRVAG